MTTKKSSDVHIRRLTKVAGGTSYAVTVPMEFVRKLGWRARQKLEVDLDGKKVVIRDWKKK